MTLGLVSHVTREESGVRFWSQSQSVLNKTYSTFRFLPMLNCKPPYQTKALIKKKKIKTQPFLWLGLSSTRKLSFKLTNAIFILCTLSRLVLTLFLSLIADGNFTTWGPWGPCSASCAGGVQTRFRSCTNPPPINNGADCQGSRNDTQLCNIHLCPGTVLF